MSVDHVCNQKQLQFFVPPVHVMKESRTREEYEGSKQAARCRISCGQMKCILKKYFSATDSLRPVCLDQAEWTPDRTF